MKLLDLFCGAGGAAMGYYRAGFTDITGVDIKPQPRYPFKFIQADAMTFALDGYDLIHASPPCQRYSEATPMQYRSRHPDLISAVRELCSHFPYVIENVEGARKELKETIMLCGTMFGLPIWRHRYFEIRPMLLLLTPPCNHNRRPIVIHSGSYTRATYEPVFVSGGGDGRGKGCRNPRPREAVATSKIAMEIPWMTQAELSQAIPPAYTEFIGRRIMEYEHNRKSGG